jgi:phosphoglycerate kinase
MKTLKDFNFQNKKVLLRTSFDVPINKKGEIEDDFRIKKSLSTIEYLLEKGAAVIIISHLGRPSAGERIGLKPIAERLEKLLKREVIFAGDCVGKAAQTAQSSIKTGQVLFLENLRFNKGEEENSEEFSKMLASFADIYVNDAFSVCHRKHASMVGIPKHIPSCAGLMLEQEIAILSSAIQEPQKPLTVVLGGAKIETKLPLLINFLDIADHLLIGGKLAPVILGAKEISMTSLYPGEEIEKKLVGLELTNPKLHMPIDALVGLKNHDEDYLRQSAVGKIRSEEQMFDIGPETVRIFSDIIEQSKTIIWNGPMGYTEDKRFASGTLAVASVILRSGAYSIAGGGDTVAFLVENNLHDKFSYISTGGGAMMDFFSRKELVGIKALED